MAIDTWPEAMLLIIIGMKNGLTRSGPRSSRFWCCVSNVSMPPMPGTDDHADAVGVEVRHVEAGVRDGLAGRDDRELDEAVHALRLLALHPRGSGSKSFTSAAMRVAYAVASKRVIGVTPLFPAHRFDQNVSTSLPSGEIAPMPVMTTFAFFPRSLVSLVVRRCVGARGSGALERVPILPPASSSSSSRAPSGSSARRRRS